MIVIIDYAGGNLFSIIKALNFLGVKSIVSNDPEDWYRGEGLIFPGQGNFSQAISEFKKDGRDQILKDLIREKPFLGICLGLQILFEESQEAPLCKGLGIFRGTVKRLPAKKIPHLGWNEIKLIKRGKLFEDIPDKSFFYFAHSYYVESLEDITSGITDYSIEFASYIEKDNIFGVQFHPEKSSKLGLKVLQNFIKESGRC
ncbi:MAG TPA: imidazole glycerol phosphate synthase subunit HisH [Dictyoglomaceae bacterium]|nr:imidazole glycerol phosphate synthase subunit HisH [Dictyoglomaceae bacterium]HOL38695.1 imidazole glycerol phosphate synthase subunit HisH [Dictyoglomaceae bacterium]HOP94601.1 imidazole glycerol phosphate synthase subunit HisH [Dictyoglomaceae bacterium]HPP15556.1 imidazole glycerol phosphate synthase subunit HisH [Dictyoglomaceae bacterium]HPU42871.1 imidazole glycerol phosphate synthase subunit HisH [Dictyoglomaceae bacterium]